MEDWKIALGGKTEAQREAGIHQHLRETGPVSHGPSAAHTCHALAQQCHTVLAPGSISPGYSSREIVLDIVKLLLLHFHHSLYLTESLEENSISSRFHRSIFGEEWKEKMVVVFSHRTTSNVSGCQLLTSEYFYQNISATEA